MGFKIKIDRVIGRHRRGIDGGVLGVREGGHIVTIDSAGQIDAGIGYGDGAILPRTKHIREYTEAAYREDIGKPLPLVL